MMEENIVHEDMVVTEFGNVTTVADVRRALEGLPDDLAVTDAMGTPLMISVVVPVDVAQARYVEVA